MTEGCPGGSRGQMGMGFVDKGRMPHKDPRPWEGKRDTWEMVLAGLNGLCHLIPLPGPCQAG